MPKDLYVVFNGMFLFNWKKDKTLEVYVPYNANHHHQVARTEDLTVTDPLPEDKLLTIPGLVASSTPHRFSKNYDLVIDGEILEIDASARVHAMLTLPMPDQTWSCSSYWVHSDEYVKRTDPRATLSIVSPGRVDTKPPVGKKDAFCVSEVFVLKYSNAEPSGIVDGLGNRIPAIELDGIQALVVLSTVDAAHAGHEHNTGFNSLLKYSRSSGRTGNSEYRPSATPDQLMMDRAYPKMPASSPPLPPNWLVPKLAANKVILSASGMGSCDDGHRCEECG